MMKILVGVIGSAVIAVGGFFGFELYTQHRIAGEVDAAFDQIRTAGGKASHGKISFDLRSRTVTIADITTETATQPRANVTIGSVTASNVGQPDAARFSADIIEAKDIEIRASLAGKADAQFTYKVPQIIVKDYSGPAKISQPAASASIIDIYRSALEQFGAVSASSVTIPGITGTINSGVVMAGDFTYSGLALQDIKNGKIAAMTVERVAFMANTQQAGKADKLTGEIANIVSHDFDATAAAAILDPQKATDDRYYRAYGLTTAGPYTITTNQGVQMRIDGFAIDELSVQPSRMQLPALLAMMPPADGTPPTPAQARDIIEKVTGIYQGMRIGNTEMRGMSIDTPQGPLKLASIRFNLDNGKFGEFAMEGLDGHTPTGPFKVGRFALKSLDIVNLMRAMAMFSNPAQKPSPGQLVGLMALLDGVEIHGIAAPFKNTGKPVTIDKFDLNWGQFVGPIPTKLHLSAKAATPVDPTDPKSKVLIAIGIDRLAADCDVGAAWTEQSQAFALDVPALDVDGIAKASAHLSLAHVPQQIFSLDPKQATAMAAQVEAGPIEVTLRDSGGVDLLVTQYARIQNVSRDAARQAIVETIRTHGATFVQANPDASAIVEAVAHFIETSRMALTLKLTPLAKVPVMQLIKLLQTDPASAVSQFRLEASTAL